NIMLDNMIVNVAGLPGHGMGIDMNIEHLIGTLKGLLAAKGVYLDWYRYRQITAAIKYLEALKETVRTSMGTAYQKVGHTDPDTSLLGQRIFEAVKKWKLLIQQPIREGVERAVIFPDLHAVGQRKYESAGLKTFNTALKDLKSSVLLCSEDGELVITTEIDDLQPLDFAEIADSEK
ncbi:hypothetical protein K435DRAFT_692876, partial [Dendrothele bispora CBS 962.96]